MSRNIFASVSGLALLAFSSAASADSNTIFLNQQDAGNNATITQSGSGNKAGRSATDTISQSGGAGGTGGNSVDIEQTGTGGTVASATFYPGGMARPDTTQRGTGNALTVRQGGTDNSFFVSQHGSHPSTLPGNTATPLDPSLVPASGWNTLIQSGSTNTATVQQGRNDDQPPAFTQTSSGDERNAAFIIRQSGSSSSVFVGQTNGSNGVTYVDQSATNSAINFSQGYREENPGQGFAGNYNYAEFHQSGSGNNLSPDQNGANLRMFMTQAGSGNFVLGRQSAFSSTMSVSQTGNSGSRVYAFQGYTVPQARSGANDYQVTPPLAGTNISGYNGLDASQTVGSMLTVNQTASNATVGFTQVGVGEIAMLTQMGAGNGLYGQQSGTSNTAIMTQSGGSSNNMFLSQLGTGSGNSATLNQDGGTGNFIYLAQTGANRADVAQGVANGNSSTNMQSGSGNMLTVRQNRT